MKKLMMLIFLMMMSWRCFSQIAIDSISIQLEKPIAKLIIKDLLIGDGYKTELSLINTKVNLLEQKVFLKDSIIFNLNTKTSNFENILFTKENQLAVSQKLTKNLQTDLKKQKIKTKLFGGTGILITAGVIFLLK
tara:strand:+ start:275 stop:679 length:405 start_codon:yes stop_codon:yes gene_type:complete